MIFRRLFSTLPNKSTHFIKNLSNVACIDCKNFQKHINVYGPNTEIHLSTCSEYGYKDLITGKIVNDLAIDCRNDQFKCTINAKKFIKKDDIIIK